MGLFSKEISTLEELFEHGLKDIYYAENQILKALPELIESATNPQLKKGLEGSSQRDRRAGAADRADF